VKAMEERASKQKDYYAHLFSRYTGNAILSNMRYTFLASQNKVRKQKYSKKVDHAYPLLWFSSHTHNSTTP